MELFRAQKQAQTRWANFENPRGEKGQGGQENAGAKGHAFEPLVAGETKVLLDVPGCGIIRHIWLTVTDRSPEILRSLRLEMFWDRAPTPAIAAPVGDFFCTGLGQLVPFENELFSSPEGRSFNCFAPMPFRTGARITLTNDSTEDLSHLFYQVNYVLTVDYSSTNELAKDALYFHAFWHRERPTRLGEDFEILPLVHGEGRYIGANIGVITYPIYAGTWWGEGQVKIFLDGDRPHPTLVNTGTEDYIGTGWGQGVFAHRYQGSLIADRENGLWSFYRLHIPDPVCFHQECRVTLQQMGGALKGVLLKLKERGTRLRIVSADRDGQLIRALEHDPPMRLEDDRIDLHDWCNYYRQDDVCATAYFYLDQPENGLPPIATCAERIARLPTPTDDAGAEPETAPLIPPTILETMVEKGSLRAQGDGFALTFTNSIVPGTITAVAGLDVDHQAVDTSQISVVSPGGDDLPASAISDERALPFPVGTHITVRVAGTRLKHGPHRIALHLTFLEVGPLTIPAVDVLG